MINRIGLDVTESVLRFLDLPVAAKASGISQQWHRVHRRRGAVIGYHPPEWFADRRDQTDPDDIRFESMAASLALINTHTVEWLVVFIPINHPFNLAAFNNEVLTEFVVAWLAMQSLPALRSLYVRIPSSFSAEGGVERPYPNQEYYYRVKHTLSLVCRADRTPRLTEFGLNVCDPLNEFRKIWLGLRPRSLLMVKACFRGGPRSIADCRSIGTDTLANVLSCAAANITCHVSGEVRTRTQGMAPTLPVLDDTTDRFALAFNACDSIPNFVLSHMMLHNTCARLDVTVHLGGGGGGRGRRWVVSIGGTTIWKRGPRSTEVN